MIAESAKSTPPAAPRHPHTTYSFPKRPKETTSRTHHPPHMIIELKNAVLLEAPEKSGCMIILLANCKSEL